MAKALSADQVRALPASTDLETAGRCFGLGRTTSYQLARSDEFPTRVLRLGSQWRVTRADIMVALGIAEESADRAEAPNDGQA
jgi:hypothetical protein